MVVTGGGGGIGAAVATELGRRGAHVVTVDPLVSVDGTEQLPAPEETTAGRIVAAGGSAEASTASVTDAEAMAELFDRLATERGRVDGVVNVAGITRPTGFAKGTAEDWGAVLSVHLDGYVNVLSAALSHMAAAGRGAIVGVTSGSGWRAADAGAYSAAKRAVASLTWELGRVAPEGVAVNAISPIAMTRMVTAALGRAGGGAAAKPGGSSKTGGLSLAGMPAPEDLAPLAAHLAEEGAAGLRGQILFAGGSEVAVVEPPKLLEVVRTAGAGSIDAVLDTVLPAFAAAEAAQATTGGANPRFGGLYGGEPGAPEPAEARVLVATDRPELGRALAARLTATGASVEVTSALDPSGLELGGVDAIVLAPSHVAGVGTGWG
ncbi:MAG: SDR family NAD(P)-dependent oxidoreductase, partial [Acidimicrobiales bacterium]